MADDAGFGLTATGFVIMSEEDVLEHINSDMLAEFGPGITPGLSRGLLYRLNRIYAERVGSVWQLGEAINASQNPLAASGPSLDAVCAISGTVRLPATPSTVELTLVGNNATVVPSGSQAGTAAGDRWQTLADGTLANLVAWASTTLYAIGDRRSNNTRAYEVITAGTSAGSGGPTTDSDDITDGTAHWKFLGEGTAVADVEAESVATGEIVGNAGDINLIETAVGGWNSVTNLLDAHLGRTVESDADLRARRTTELARGGTATLAAIRVDVFDALEGAGFPDSVVTVFQNATNATNSDGMPAHSVEVMVQTDAGDQIVADAVLAAVAAGIETYGTTTSSAVDPAGISQVVKFTRPAELLAYVIVQISVQDGTPGDYSDEPTWPTDGADQVAAAIVAYGNTYPSARNVYASRIGREALIDSIGVIDLVDCFVGIVDPPASSSITVGTRQVARFDTTRVDVQLVV